MFKFAKMSAKNKFCENNFVGKISLKKKFCKKICQNSPKIPAKQESVKKISTKNKMSRNISPKIPSEKFVSEKIF